MSALQQVSSGFIVDYPLDDGMNPSFTGKLRVDNRDHVPLEVKWLKNETFTIAPEGGKMPVFSIKIDGKNIYWEGIFERYQERDEDFWENRSIKIVGALSISVKKEDENKAVISHNDLKDVYNGFVLLNGNESFLKFYHG